MSIEPPTYRRVAPAVVALSDGLATRLSVTGGKGANLARLIDQGFDVPDGCCVTTTVYDRLVDDEEIQRLVDRLEATDIDDTDGLRARAGRLREAIRDRQLEDRQLGAIEQMVDASSVYVARSSATAEDLPTASFAGQHDTVLDVRGTGEVADAVRRCMASVFTDRAVFYRVNNGISHREVSMAVVVQKMVDPEVSGVLFTADPMSGKRCVASIDAATGLGEAVVSGTVTAENIKVDRIGRQILRRDAEDNGDELSTAGQPSRVLTDDQVMELVSCGEAIERGFEGPQDIEWSFVDGELKVLQTRRITTLFPRPRPLADDGRLHVYYSWNHRQGMIEQMPPLVVDYWRRSMTSLFDQFGYQAEAATAGGMIYIDVTPFLRSPKVAGRLFAGLEEFDRQAIGDLEEICGRRDEFAEMTLLGSTSLTTTLEALGKLVPVAVQSLFGVIRGVVGTSYRQAPQRGRMWADQLATEMIRDIRAGDTIDQRLRIILDKNDEFIWQAMKQALLLWNLYACRAVLRRLCPGCDQELAALQRGLRDNVTTAMMLELGDVADVARESPAVEEAIEEGAGLDQIRNLDGAEPFVRGLDDFLDHYGFRAPAEIEFSGPRYRDEPSMLMSTIGSMLQTADHGEHRRHIEQLEDEAREATERMRRVADRGRFGAWKRRLVGTFARRYRAFLSLREVTKYALSQLLNEVRSQVLDAGKSLRRRGVIDEFHHVWMYDFEELLAALDEPEQGSPVDAHQRLARHRWHRQLKPARVITSDGEIPRGTIGDRPDPETFDGLVGIPTSRGVAEGVVRVIREPAGARLNHGEILVAPHTDPGWTPLFLNAAGLVTDEGGEMTHGSLVAREYGIPSVVVAGVTDQLESGQRIRVDGHRGTVEILDES